MTREKLIEQAQAFKDARDWKRIAELMADFALSVMPEWILVTERLPEEKGWYLIDPYENGMPIIAAFQLTYWNDKYGKTIFPKK